MSRPNPIVEETNPKVIEKEKLTYLDLCGLLYEAKILSAFVRGFADEASTQGEGRNMSQDELGGLFEVTHKIYEIVEKVERCATGRIDIDWGGNHD